MNREHELGKERILEMRRELQTMYWHPTVRGSYEKLCDLALSALDAQGGEAVATIGADSKAHFHIGPALPWGTKLYAYPYPPEAMLKELREALAEIVSAYDSRWSGESQRKLENAISPRMQDAFAASRALLSAKT